MKKILIILIGALTLSCSDFGKKAAQNEELKKELANMRLDVQQAIQDFKTEGDSSKLLKALEINDKLIKTDKKNEREYYEAKSYILALQEKYREAFLIQDLAIIDNELKIERTVYEGLKHQAEGANDIAYEYFDRALAICNHHLQDSISNEWIVQKAKIFIYLNKKDSAEQTLQQAWLKDPQNRTLKSVLAEFETFYQSSVKYMDDIKQK